MRQPLMIVKESNLFHGKKSCAYSKFFNTPHGIIPLIETMCGTPNMGYYGAAVAVNLEEALEKRFNL